MASSTISRGLNPATVIDIPKQWDPEWFRRFIRNILSNADIRNATQGAGIAISSTSVTPATVAASADMLALKAEPYILASAGGSELSAYRVLAVQSGVLSATDSGVRGSFTLGVVNNGIGNTQLRQGVALSVVGNSTNVTANLADITSAGNKSVLHQSGTALSFSTIDHTYISDFDTEALSAAEAGASSILDQIGSTRGDILFRGAGGWSVLAPGTSGSFLQTSGAGADPTWAASSGSGALTLIGSSTAASSVASLTVSSIPGTFSHLLIIVAGRGTVAATSANVQIQFNGDTGANYDDQILESANTTPTALQQLGQTSAFIGAISGSTATANRAGVAQCMVANYTSTTFDKVGTAHGSLPLGSSSGQLFTNQAAIVWRPATPAAITSLTVLPSSGNFATGSKLSVYGIS